MQEIVNKEAVKYFEENHYLKVEKVISEEEAFYFYDYVKLAAKRLAIIEERQPELKKFENHWIYNSLN